MGLKQTVTNILEGKADPKHLAIIRTILNSTVEEHIHQQRGATDNQVWVAKDGHTEIVVKPNGEKFSHVQDDINMGSYNYFHPDDDAVRHYFYDIHPWILMGNTRKDPTTPRERLSAYMLDLEEGIILAAKNGVYPPVDISSLRSGEAEAYAIFIIGIEKGNANEIYSLIQNLEILAHSKRAKILSKVEIGLRKLYVK